MHSLPHPFVYQFLRLLDRLDHLNHRHCLSKEAMDFSFWTTMIGICSRCPLCCRLLRRWYWQTWVFRPRISEEFHYFHRWPKTRPLGSNACNAKEKRQASSIASEVFQHPPRPHIVLIQVENSSIIYNTRTYSTKLQLQIRTNPYNNNKLNWYKLQTVIVVYCCYFNR